MHACYHDSMKQLTLRVDDDLADALKSVAAEHGESVNAYAQSVLRAAVDPAHAGSEIQRMRERLARAGLLARVKRGLESERPSEEELARARAEAGKGTPLSQLVSEGRR